MDAKEKIDKLRLERGWTLYKLSKELNISNTTVYSWYNERKYNPSRDTIAEACRVFGLTQTEFYSDIDGNETNAKEVVLIELFRSLSNTRQEQMIEIMKIFAKENT